MQIDYFKCHICAKCNQHNVYLISEYLKVKAKISRKIVEEHMKIIMEHKIYELILAKIAVKCYRTPQHYNRALKKNTPNVHEPITSNTNKRKPVGYTKISIEFVKVSHFK